MNKLSFIFDGKFYTKSEVKIPDDKSSESYVQGVIAGIKASSNKPLTAILLQQDSLYIYGYEITQKPESVIENLFSTSPKGLEMLDVTPSFRNMHENNAVSGTEYEEIDILCVWGESLYQFLPINSEFSVRGLINFLIHDLNINFHPDDKFSDYLNDENFLTDSTGNEIYFDETACAFIETLIEASFEICGDKVYDFGFEIQQAKLKFQGIEIGGDVETEEVKSTVDSDQLNAWLKRYNELPEGNEKEVAKSWVISLGGSVEDNSTENMLIENAKRIAEEIVGEYVDENEHPIEKLKEEKTVNSCINWFENVYDLLNTETNNTTYDLVVKEINNIVEKRITEKPLYNTKGNVVPKFVYDEDNDGTYREFNKKMIAGFLGQQNSYSGSADWGGIPVWSVIDEGFAATGIFVCIDDNDDVVLLRRDFDENLGENIDNELSRFDEDDTISIEYMLKCMADKSEYNGYELFGEDDFIIHKDKFSNDSKELMMNADLDPSEVKSNEEFWATATDEIKKDFDEDYVDTTLISEELADLLMNFYHAWNNLDSTWTNNSGYVNLEDLYPFGESFDDLEISVKNWIKAITGNTDEEINNFNTIYNSVSIEGDLENFKNAYINLLEWFDDNKFDEDYYQINDIIGGKTYPFLYSLDDLLSKIIEWCDASITSLENNPLANPKVISEPNIDKTKQIANEVIDYYLQTHNNMSPLENNNIREKVINDYEGETDNINDQGTTREELSNEILRIVTQNDIVEPEKEENNVEYNVEKLRERIKIFVKQNSWFADESDDETPFEMSFTSREYGNVGDERPGKIDIDKAKDIGRQLMNKFPGEVKCELSTADEWVYIEVYLRGSKQTTWVDNTETIEPVYGINGAEPVKVEETPSEWKERKNKEHEEEYKAKLDLFLGQISKDSINVKDVIDRDFKKSPQERYFKIIESDKYDVGTDEQQKILSKILGYKEVLWAKVCKEILGYSFDWDSIKEEVLESHFDNERKGYVGMYSGDLTGHSIGIVKIEGVTYYKEYPYYQSTNGYF